MSDLVAAALAAAQRRARGGVRADLRARGVVATPAELARSAVARVDQLLLSELGVGLASANVVVVDPAIGTGVWLAAVLEHTRAQGARSQLMGFDTDAAAIADAAHLLEREAASQGARLCLRCANTLELAEPFPDRASVRVILGNPPWAARSLSRGSALSDAWLAEFRRDHLGRPLAERRAGVLSDDYVRFFRWALEQARTGEGGALLCFASNASFLDGPVHRGMRAALLAAYDRIEITDLGGNSLLARAGQRDENVFGVRVGAALTWAVRTARRAAEAKVRFSLLSGSRNQKLVALDHVLPVEHVPAAPWFRFRPSAAQPIEGFSIADAFPFQREGVQTNRDAIAVDADRARLEQRLEDFANGRLELPALAHFDPAHARRALVEARERGQALIAPLAYRPFDDRFFVRIAPLCHRPRTELLEAVQRSSLCLLAVRKDRSAAAFNLFGAAKTVADACYLSTHSSCRTRVFPSHAPDGSPNLSASLAEQLAERIGVSPSPEALLLYALSVLGAPCFRQAQAAALQLDYARVPWPNSAEHFRQAAEVGRRFVEVLLSEGPLLDVGEWEHDERDQPFAAIEYDLNARVLREAGRTLVRKLPCEAMDACVGHQRVVSERCRTYEQLRARLSAATKWCAAEKAANELLFGAGGFPRHGST